MGLFSKKKTVRAVSNDAIDLWDKDKYVLKNVLVKGLIHKQDANLIIRDFFINKPSRKIDKAVKFLSVPGSTIQVSFSVDITLHDLHQYLKCDKPVVDSIWYSRWKGGLEVVPGVERQASLDRMNNMGISVSPNTYPLENWEIKRYYDQAASSQETLKYIVEQGDDIFNVYHRSYNPFLATSEPNLFINNCGNLAPIKEDYNYIDEQSDEFKNLKRSFRLFELPLTLLIKDIKEHEDTDKMRSVYAGLLCPLNVEKQYSLAQWFWLFYEMYKLKEIEPSSYDLSNADTSNFIYSVDANGYRTGEGKIFYVEKIYNANFVNHLEFDISITAKDIEYTDTNNPPLQRTDCPDSSHIEYIGGFIDDDITIIRTNTETNTTTTIKCIDFKYKSSYSSGYNAGTNPKTNKIYKLTDYDVLDSESMDKMYEEIVIPMNHKILVPQSIKKDEMEFFLKHSFYVLTYIRYTQKLKWYQTGIFKIFLKAIAIVSLVLTLGSSASLSAFLFTIAGGAAIGLAIQELSKILIKAFGNDIGLLLAVTAVIYAGIKTGELDFKSLQKSVMSSLHITNRAISLKNEATYREIQKEIDLLKEKEDELTELQQKQLVQKEVDLTGDYSDYDFTEEETRHPMEDYTLTPEEFYAIKLNIDHIPLIMNYAELFTIMMENPDLINNKNKDT